MTRYFAQNDIGLAKELVESNNYLLSLQNAKKPAFSMGFAEEEIKDVLLKLTSKDCYKSERDQYNPQIWQDYFKTHNVYQDYALFVKWKIVYDEEDDSQLLIVTSFKEDTDSCL